MGRRRCAQAPAKPLARTIATRSRTGLARRSRTVSRRVARCRLHASRSRSAARRDRAVAGRATPLLGPRARCLAGPRRRLSAVDAGYVDGCGRGRLGRRRISGRTRRPYRPLPDRPHATPAASVPNRERRRRTIGGDPLVSEVSRCLVLLRTSRRQRRRLPWRNR